jgi:DNA topoisomerase 2-associated protein PAT1
MGDSFFGFNTNLPPLTDDELHSLKVQGINNNGDSEAAYHEHSDADIYDFETLRHELGVDDEQEESDGLGEEADDYNNITFNEIPTGKSSKNKNM